MYKCIFSGFFGIAFLTFVKGFLPQHKYNVVGINNNYKYPLSRPHFDKYLKHIKNNTNNIENKNNVVDNFLKKRNYPLSRNYFEGLIKKLNSRNITEQNYEILGNDESSKNKTIRIIIGKPLFNFQENGGYNDLEDDFYENNKKSSVSKKSDSFEVIVDYETNFTSVGGYN
jgi:hypothetical protein